MQKTERNVCHAWPCVAHLDNKHGACQTHADVGQHIDTDTHAAPTDSYPWRLSCTIFATKCIRARSLRVLSVSSNVKRTASEGRLLLRIRFAANPYTFQTYTVQYFGAAFANVLLLPTSNQTKRSFSDWSSLLVKQIVRRSTIVYRYG